MNSSKSDFDRLFDLLSDFKQDIARRFDENDKRIDGLDKRIDGLDRRMDHLQNDFQRYETKLDEVYDCRREVAVKFTRDWRFASFLIAMGASGLTLCIALIISRII